MVHTIKVVADCSLLDQDEFVSFCKEHGEKLGAFYERGEMVVSTWFSNDLVNAAIKSGVSRLTIEEINKRYS